MKNWAIRLNIPQAIVLLANIAAALLLDWVNHA